MLRKTLKSIMDIVTHPLGLNVIPYFGDNISLKQVNKLLEEKKVNLVLDVGANTGQYATSIQKAGYQGRLISFEPLIDVHRELVKNSRRYKNWEIYERCAIGDYNGTTVINVSQNKFSSSILPINSTHTKAAPDAAYIGQQETPVYTLDSIAGKIINNDNRVCLKIDTQGFEDKVITGAIHTLGRVEVIQVELSLMPLYDGSKTFNWMLPFLQSLHFEPVMYFPGYIDRLTEQIQQLEGLFIKKN